MRATLTFCVLFIGAAALAQEQTVTPLFQTNLNDLPNREGLMLTVDLPPGSRIVMLAPPNHGSELADHVRHWPLYRWLMGPAGQQVGTGADSIVHRLEPIKAEVGVIAANRSLQPWFSWLLPGANDGAVTVASTRLTEMRDFIVVDSSHTLLMINRQVRRQVRHFLAEGRFAR